MPHRTWQDRDLQKHVPLVNTWRALFRALQVTGGAYTQRAIREACERLNLSTEHFAVERQRLNNRVLREKGLRVCCICKLPKSLVEFSFKSLKKKLRAFTCIGCQKEASKAHYKANKAVYKKRAVTFSKKNVESNRLKIWEYLLQHPCVQCGESDVIQLDFDHLRDKHQAISSMINGHSWTSIAKEIEKCQVLCVRCHRIKTAAQLGWFKHIKKLQARASSSAEEQGSHKP